MEIKHIKTYRVFYELPPLRAIFDRYIDAEDKEDARQIISKEEQNVKIRSISEIHSKVV